MLLLNRGCGINNITRTCPQALVDIDTRCAGQEALVEHSMSATFLQPVRPGSLLKFITQVRAFAIMGMICLLAGLECLSCLGLAAEYRCMSWRIASLGAADTCMYNACCAEC